MLQLMHLNDKLSSKMKRKLKLKLALNFLLHFIHYLNIIKERKNGFGLQYLS